MNIVTNFIINGVPVAKGRPRMGKWGTYTPKKTVDAEKKVVEAYLEEVKEPPISEHPLKIDMTFLFPIPKSYTKKQRAEIEKMNFIHTKRPDRDNLEKLVLDALNGVAYKDDSQVYTGETTKKYTLGEPCTIVKITEIVNE